MVTATATVDNDFTVSLVTDDTGPGTWKRVTNTGTDRLVAQTPEASDRFVPLNVPVTYYWTGPGGVATTASVTVTASVPVLSSTLGRGYVQVVVVSQPPLEWVAKSVVHEVIGRPDPVVAVAPARYPSGTLVLDAPDRRQRLAVLSLLAAGDPLILRATCPAAVDDMTFQPMRWRDPLVSEAFKGGGRRIEVEYQSVTSAPMQYVPNPPWTWADVEASYATWADVEAAYGSWYALLEGPR
jgi:hypothetical protein